MCMCLIILLNGDMERGCEKSPKMVPLLLCTFKHIYMFIYLIHWFAKNCHQCRWKRVIRSISFGELSITLPAIGKDFFVHHLELEIKYQ